MYNKRKNTIKIFLIAIVLSISLMPLANNSLINRNYNFLLTFNTDTVPTIKINKDSSIKNIIDTSINNNKTITTIDTFNINFSKDSLEATVLRNANDSAVFWVKENKFLLYNKASATYLDNKIDADFIRLDNKKETLFARGLFDSTGKKIDEQLVMKTTDQNITADSLTYQIKTGKAITANVNTQSDEMFIHSQKSKLLGDKKSFFGYKNLFTTCNLDEPHFAFFAKKIKVVANDIAVSGFTNPEIEGVPLPIGIPFGIFPMKKGRHGGLLPPQFTTNEKLGVGLEGLGYYFIVGDNWDFTTRTNLYSYGSWNAIITPNYRKRYKYSGGFDLNIQNTKQNFKGDEDYVKNKSFQFSWRHTADTRARPGITFGANVNFGTGTFNSYNPNNLTKRLNNQMGSSINWSKTWQDKPFNIAITANHSQNTETRLVNINLPEITFNVQPIFPFAKKNSVGKGNWYEKISIAYNGNLRNKMTFRDYLPIKEIIQSIKDTFQWGASHSIPISLSLPSLGPFQVGPTINYEERTFGSKILRSYNTSTKKVDTLIQKGVYEARQLGFGVGLSTALFGTYNFKNKSIIAARHVMRPQISMNYVPNMNQKYNSTIQVDSTGRTMQVNVFDGNLYIPFNGLRNAGIGFGLDNNVEIKVRKKGDTTKEAIRKIRLIDGLGFTGSYNFLATKFKLSNINLNFRSTLANGKLNITAGAILDPYQVSSFGNRIDKYAWIDQKFGISSFGRITNVNISLSTQFSGGDKNKNNSQNGLNNNSKNRTNAGTSDMSMDEQLRLNEYMNNNPSEFVDFNIPWDLNLSGTVNLANTLQPNYTYKKEYNASMNIGGNFSLTPKWKCGANSNYDFINSKVQTLQMFITREMHCWQLAINVTPIGYAKSFNITFNPKAGILRDLKINRTRFFYGE